MHQLRPALPFTFKFSFSKFNFIFIFDLSFSFGLSIFKIHLSREDSFMLTLIFLITFISFTLLVFIILKLLLHLI